MEVQAPAFVANEVWQLSETQADWNSISDGYTRRVIECLKYMIYCQISNDHKHRNMSRYIFLKWHNKEFAEQIAEENGVTVRQLAEGGLLDKKLRVVIRVRLVISLSTEADHTLQLETNEVLIVIDKTGRLNVSSPGVIDKAQSQLCSSCMVKCTQWFSSQNQEQLLDLVLSTGHSTHVTIPKLLAGLLIKDSDLTFIPDTTTKGEDSTLLGKPWTQMKKLPKFDLNEDKQPQHWKPFLIACDSRYTMSEFASDQVVCKEISDRVETVVLKRQGHTGNDEVQTIMTSLKFYADGGNRRHIESCDIKSFGVNLKRKKKIKYEQLYGTPLEEEWKRADYPIEHKSMPKWVPEELNDLDKKDSVEWIELERPYTHCELDEISEDIADKFLEAVTCTWAAAVMEKWVTASTKVYQELNTDRNKVTFLPISTRRCIYGTPMTQLWGFVCLGPHHLKHDSDRVPLVVLEFVGSDNPRKYPNHAYGYFKYIDAKDPQSVQPFLLRSTSIAKYRLFYFMAMRKCMIQPSSAFSKTVMNNAVLKGKMDLSEDVQVELFIYSDEEHTKLVAARMSALIWATKMLSMHLLMAIWNDNQMEGFLANIRRLHMCRQAMVLKKGVFIPYGSSPESKCQECIINNPIVLYLAKTWNDLPDIYYV